MPLLDTHTTAATSDPRILQAQEVLRRNDRGQYTVPTHGLYPFQWNWDSALAALGFDHFDEDRAWTEIETLMAHQWDDGMVPHIIFHEHDDGYFPGPDVYRTNRPTPTSGITQPPVAGFAVRRMLDRAEDRAMAERRARALVPKLHDWHRWFYRARDPQNTGLIALVHPWESGRDNSVDWDAALARVPTTGVEPFQRRDIQHANPEHRPTHDQYVRYIWLVQHFRDMNWDPARVHDASPFQMVDPGFNAILIRACADVADLADRFDMPEIAAEAREMMANGLAALETLWNDKLGQYTCYDRAGDTLLDCPTIGGILTAFAPIPAHRAAELARRIEVIGAHSNYLLASHDPTAPEFDGRRYWRGPVWLIVNYMIADGMARAGEAAVAAQLKRDSVRLIEESGFAEYYDPITAEPCGGGNFTWTAAMVIEFLSLPDIAQ